MDVSLIFLNFFKIDFQFIDLVESSPEPYDDHRTSAFQMEGSRTVKSERSGIRWGTNCNLSRRIYLRKVFKFF